MSDRPLSDTDELTKLQMKYARLMHAMQTGIAVLMNYNPKETEPKHLRVGVNSALLDSSAVVKLLVSKGIITELEYFRELVALVQADLDSYQEQIQKITGTKIVLA